MHSGTQFGSDLAGFGGPQSSKHIELRHAAQVRPGRQDLQLLLRVNVA